jgi:hypothetical protein
MKTILSNGTLMIIAFTGIFLSSCTKESENETKIGSEIRSYNPDSKNSQSYLGTIEDLGIVQNNGVVGGDYLLIRPTIFPFGIVGGNSRIIRVTIYPSGFIMNSWMDNHLRNPDLVEVMFYVNRMFAYIPAGEYSFSNSDPISDGTFNSRTITGEYYSSGEEMLGGLVTVSNNNGEYSFDFNCILSSGKPFSGIFSGSLAPWGDGN